MKWKKENKIDSNNKEAEAETSMDGQKQETKLKMETETVVTDKNSSRALVVYFSWSGNTDSVANAIARQTGADVFAIVPEKPYTDDYDALLNIAAQEKESSIRPAIAESIENIDQYDIIYAGYPNWWSSTPMAVFSFLEEYDLSGKAIVPFCAHGTGGIAGSVRDIKTALPDSVEILEPIGVYRSDIDSAQTVINDWLDSFRYTEDMKGMNVFLPLETQYSDDLICSFRVRAAFFFRHFEIAAFRI